MEQNVNNMNSAGLMKYASALVALTICAACSSAGASSTGGLNYQFVCKVLYVNGRPVTAARLNPMPRYATLVPDRHTKSKTFEYVFNSYGTYASIFDYPKSVKEIGQIKGDRGQGRTNVLYGYGKKTFWNIGGQNQITEYKVPQTPIKTLSVAYSFPTSCAMD